MIGAESIDI